MRDSEVRDSEVVAKIVAGDPKGLAVAYDKYADVLYTYCRSVLRDPADAADAVQDTFVIAASRLDGLRDPEKLRSWLYTVARNECMRILRSNKDTSALDEAPDVIDDTIDIGADAERTELRTLFRDASGGLNDSEREVIELSLRHKMEASEIAGVLGVSSNHAHSLLSRARAQMEACLGALLVGRSGRDECGELRGLLSGWDGSLTVLLRKRLHRHIEHCSTCTSRRAFELRPAAFLGLPPLVAIAGALRWLAVPDPLKGKILALATGTSSAAAAHRAAVLHRAGTFNHHGFPHVVHAKAGVAHGAGAKASSFLKTPQGQGTVAAVVLAIIAASTAAALTGNNTEHVSLANGGHGQGAGGGSGGGAGGGGGSGGGGGAGGGSGAGGGGGSGSGSGSGHGGSGSGSSGSGGSGSGSSGSGSGSGGNGSGSSPSGSQTGQSSPGGSSPSSGLSAPSAPSAPGGTTPGSPSSGSSPSSPAKPTPTGTVTTPSNLPAVMTVGPNGSQITVQNSGTGQAYYTVSVTGGSGKVTASPASGSLAPGASKTVTLNTVSTTAMGQTVTLEPSGQQWTVVAGWSNPGTPSLPGLPGLPSLPGTQSASATPVPTPSVPTPSIPTPSVPATPSVPDPIKSLTPASATPSRQQKTGSPSPSSSPACSVYTVLPKGLQPTDGSCP